MGRYYSTKDFTNDIYVPVPLDMVTNEKLCSMFSYGEVILYSLIKYRMRLSAMNSLQFEDENGLFVVYSQKELAEMLHKEERTVRRWFKSLKDAGWIKVVQTGVGEAAKIYLKNVYAILDDDGRTKMSAVQDKNVRRGRTKMSAVAGQKCPPATIENKDIDNNTDNEYKEIDKESSGLSVSNQIIQFCGPEIELKESLDDWKAFREKAKAPLTKNATHRALKKLFSLSNGDVRVMIDIVNQSVDNGWKGFFPLKAMKQKSQGSKVRRVYEQLEEQDGKIEEDFSDII